MRTDNNNNHLIASEGKLLRRISDGWVAGKEIYLGYAYYLGGEKLEEPLWELPEHYEEVDADNNTDAITDADFEEVVDDLTSVMTLSLADASDKGSPAVPEPPARSTLADLLSRALAEIDELRREVYELRRKE